MELEDECGNDGIQEELERGRVERYNHNTLYTCVKLPKNKTWVFAVIGF